MELTDQQKEINPSEIYWRWFQAWWDEDFSFENVCAGDIFTEVSLSNYSSYSKEKLVDFGGREWHPIHLPPHDLVGKLSTKELSRSQNEGSVHLNYVGRSDGVLRRDIGKNFTKGGSEISWYSIENEGGYKPSTNFYNCYISHNQLMAGVYEACFFNAEELKKPKNSFIAAKDVKFTNCYFKKSTEIRTENKVTILSGVNLQSLKCVSSSALIISDTPMDGLQYSSVNPLIANIELTSEAVEIKFLGLASAGTTIAEVTLYGGNDHSVHLENLAVKKFTSLDVEHIAFSKLGTLEIVDCKFTNALELKCDSIEKVYCRRSVLSNGFSLKDTKVTGAAKFRGVSVFDYANFDKTTFEHGFLCIPDRYPDGTISEAILENASFEGVTFTDHERSPKSSCVNFNDSKFVGSASFNRAVFDGIPKFHGTTLHSETSFMDLGLIPEIDGKVETTSERYGEYQSAFRALRQHMENNHSSAMAFKFGRREMISKQRRTEYVDVPKIEVKLTKLYGKIADYGQSFICPSLYLLLVFLASLVYQCSVFLATTSTCFSTSPQCKINWATAGEAFERGVVFSIPPFTLLTNRTLDSKDISTTEWYTDILSAFGMLLHGVAATTLVFLIVLAIRRRMQIK